MAKKLRKKSEEVTVGCEPRKLTKREQDIQRARTEGYHDARREFDLRLAAVEAGFKTKYENQRAAMHLDALRTIRDLASAYGQMMGEIGRAMQSEKGQL